MNRYVCSECGFSGNLAKQPNFCPECGKESTVTKDLRKAKETAKRLVSELQEQDIPVLESLFSGYAAQWIKIERKMQILRKYKQRGAISKEEMPNVPRSNLAERLNQCRRENKLNAKTENDDAEE